MASPYLPAMEIGPSGPSLGAATGSSANPWLLLAAVGAGLYLASRARGGLGGPDDDAPADLAGPPRRKPVPRPAPKPVARPAKPRTHGQHVAHLVIS